jgi:peptidoglycan L-alanyl-D-glutamate endopeptidase CwlK
MMPKFSPTSEARLGTCDSRLVVLFHRVVAVYDCTILEGHRGQEAQDRAHAEGRSKLKWPDGNHNRFPSNAVDAAPFDAEKAGVNWNTDVKTPEGRANLARFYHFAGIVQGVASQMGLRVRWGGDWDSDTRFDDQTFQDLVHFELLP